MASPFGSYPFDAAGVDNFSHPLFINWNRAPTSLDVYPAGTQIQDNSVNPPIIYQTSGYGNWDTGGIEPATTTRYGTVILTDNNEPVATKFYVDAIAIAGAPVATETVAGIGQLATDAEAIAGTPSTGLLALFVTPSNLAPVLASPPAIGGSTPAAGSFTDLSATGTISIASAAPITIDVTGAGNDLTLSSDAGRVIVNGEEAAANAITLVSAAGGIDVDAALQINIATSQSAVDAIRIVASAGGIDIDAVGAAGEDINITNTGASIVLSATESAVDAIVINATLGGIDILASGASAGEDIDITASGSSVNITATENDAGAVIVRANGGASERVTLLASQGTGADSINLESTAGGITLSAALASADAINLAAAAGGVDIDGALQVNIASSQNAVDAIRIVASAGGIDIDAVGAAGEDINITNTGGSIVLSATESAVDAIVIQSTAGGIDILASGAAAGEDIDITATGSSVNISATENDAGAITIGTNGGTSERITVTCAQGTNAASIALTSTAGGLTFTGGLGTADAINFAANTAGGGIDIDSSTGGFIVDTTGAVSLDSATTSNFTVTGATADLNLLSVGGSVLVEATEDVALAIRLHANGGTSETIQVHADQGTGVASVGLLSDVGGITLRATGLASADAINLEAAAGGVDVDAALQINIASSQAAATAVQITASDAGAGGITLTAGSGGVNVTGATVVTGALTTSGDLTLSSVATKISMNGGAVTDFIGRATLVGGTVTVANTNIAAGDRIFLTRSALNASPALGSPVTTISAGASWSIQSYTDAGAAAATDVTTFDYFIVRQT